MEVKHIIVQAGGKGTRMEHLTHNKPKALVPIDNLPMIFHLFRKFPDREFLIIGDYKYEVLERYLAAFSDVSYKMIDARGKKGTCAGIGEAMSHIPDGEPFMLTWCDLILPDEYEIPSGVGNYIGISKGFRCRWSYEEGKLEESPSDEHGVAGHFLFAEKAEIADVPKEGEFVRWLRDAGISGRHGKDSTFRELPLDRTKEYGLISEYPEQKGGRCRPFNRITIDGDRLIKEGIDEQGRKLAVRERAWYAKVKDEGFTNIPKIYETDPLIMERIDGKNIFEYELSYEEKKEVLGQLVGCLRRLHEMDGCKADEASYYEAYIGKTFDRLSKVRGLVPFADDEYVTINGISCRNVFYCRKELEDAVMGYMPKEFRFLHGDCTFSNMMLRSDGTPVMIDPRGYFGNTELYGDPAYDWVKLYYSIAGNYDQFNLRRFRLDIREKDVTLNIDSNGWEDMEDEFFRLLNEEVTRHQMKLLHSIIYLSLTTYAWEDYDSVCGAFYKGLQLLEEAMSGIGSMRKGERK
ncbi:MAG: phosphotransferase [Lachnospiraceae bacterium]|nr:phosphotransferase [Lachnospiraceae bacterium]